MYSRKVNVKNCNSGERGGSTLEALFGNTRQVFDRAGKAQLGVVHLDGWAGTFNAAM